MLVTLLFYVSPLILFLHLYSVYHRLRTIPGPRVNRYTDLARLLSVYRRDPHNELLQLHRKYGDVVRLGPNCVSVSGVGYVPQIYGIGKGMVKSDYYAVFQNIVNGKRAASLVAMIDESDHARTKRQIANAYSLSTLVDFEPLVDRTTKVFLDILGERFCGSGKGLVCDLGAYLQYYAFDLIGELTFSKRLGFIESGTDVDNIITSIGANFSYFSVLGQMPWLDTWLLGKNPIYVRYLRKMVGSPILKFAQKLLKERLDEMEAEDSHRSNSEKATQASSKPDFLTRFLKLRKEEGEEMNDRQLLSYLFMNINAGSDTIASTLKGIFYFLLKNQASLDRLVAELQVAHEQGALTLPCPTWHEIQSDECQYLRAVIKEGLRLNPALSLPLERVVPRDGLHLKHAASFTSTSSALRAEPSTAIPAGTIIGINPYVLGRDKQVFGDDADIWRPERWLANPSSSSPTQPQSEPTDREQEIKTMSDHLLAFGAGKRSCLGRNIAMLELHKIIPALLMRFDIRPATAAATTTTTTNHSPQKIKEGGKERADQEWGWTVQNKWVLEQKGLNVVIFPRASDERG